MSCVWYNLINKNENVVVNVCTKHTIILLEYDKQYLIEAKKNPRSLERSTSVRSPYMPELLCHKTKFIDGT